MGGGGDDDVVTDFDECVCGTACQTRTGGAGLCGTDDLSCEAWASVDCACPCGDVCEVVPAATGNASSSPPPSAAAVVLGRCNRDGTCSELLYLLDWTCPVVSAAPRLALATAVAVVAVVASAMHASLML